MLRIYPGVSFVCVLRTQTNKTNVIVEQRPSRASANYIDSHYIRLWGHEAPQLKHIDRVGAPHLPMSIGRPAPYTNRAGRRPKGPHGTARVVFYRPTSPKGRAVKLKVVLYDQHNLVLGLRAQHLRPDNTGGVYTPPCAGRSALF